MFLSQLIHNHIDNQNKDLFFLCFLYNFNVVIYFPLLFNEISTYAGLQMSTDLSKNRSVSLVLQESTLNIEIHT